MPKSVGYALIVAGDAARQSATRALTRLGYETDQRDDPYAAMLEICRRPLVYRAVVLSLQALYRDELTMISTIRRRFPHISIWLTQTDGRQAALAEAMRLGAEGLLADDGVHPLVDSPHPTMTPLTPLPAHAPPTQFRPAPVQETPPEPEPTPQLKSDRAGHRSPVSPEPVLTADELRALLGDQL